MQANNLFVLLGPTASGKTRLGVQLAGLVGGEIVSADSRQVFRGMDIGTGKDLAEYGDVPYHLIDIVDAGSEYSVFNFQRDCLRAFDAIWSRELIPVLVGGTGLYLESVLQGYRMVEVPVDPVLRSELERLEDGQLRERLRAARPEQHNRTDLEDRERLIRAIDVAEGADRAGEMLPPFPALRARVYGLSWPRSELRKRITQRLRDRLANGMIEEVAGLHDAGVSWEALEFYGLEYRFIARHLQGELNRNDMFQKLNSAIHQFAKRQETWFRRMEKNGTEIHWLEGAHDPFSALCEDLEKHGVTFPVGARE